MSAPQEPRAGQQPQQQQQQRPISAQGSVASSEITLTRWQKIENVIWDGGHRTPQERALVRRLDIFIMFVILFINHRNIGPLTCRLSEIGAGLQLATLCDCWIGLMSVSKLPNASLYTVRKTNHVIANAYVSGMKEDLHFTGADYNLLSTFFIIGYVIGQVPSQMVLTRGKI